MSMIIAADISSQINQWVDTAGPLAKYIGALLIFLIGKFVAKRVGNAIGKVAGRAGLDQKLSKYLGGAGASPSGMIGSLVGGILLLFVIIFALDFAGLSNVTQPLNDLLGKFLGIIPNIVGAGIVGFLFFILAKVISGIVLSLLQATKVDERLGMDAEKGPIANGLSTVVFALLVLFGLASALNILGIEAISKPVSGIVDSIIGAVPNIILAAAILTIGVFIAGLVRRIVTNLLVGINADQLPAKMGLNVPTEGSRSLSSIVGLITFTSIVVMMAAAALKELRIDILSDASENIFSGYFNILIALIIVGAGIIAAKYAYGALADKNIILARVAKFGIIIMSSVAALNRSGIAPEITGAPYQALVTAAALALGLGGAIAIGLGGKDFVARFLEKKG